MAGSGSGGGGCEMRDGKWTREGGEENCHQDKRGRALKWLVTRGRSVGDVVG